ncbi:hypothetical protein AKN87_02965 [Thiopseudomonas alkaliphila]|nr:hypothetical protein AKN87_02965 [Thiopseudomonas alkaliphila]
MTTTSSRALGAWFGCFGETTLDDCVLCAKVLPSGNEAEVIQLAKAGKIRAGKGKIIHVGAWFLLV